VALEGDAVSEKPKDVGSKKITHSRWMTFYRCECCGETDEKTALREVSGPCPDCGSSELRFLTGRWRVEREELSFLQDLAVLFGLRDFPEPVFIPEYLVVRGENDGR
jgi:ssDNA-binding Zn-finger/Zn-ribbon topoisomerase 1